MYLRSESTYNKIVKARRIIEKKYKINFNDISYYIINRYICRTNKDEYMFLNPCLCQGDEVDYCRLSYHIVEDGFHNHMSFWQNRKLRYVSEPDYKYCRVCPWLRKIHHIQADYLYNFPEEAMKDPYFTRQRQFSVLFGGYPKYQFPKKWDLQLCNDTVESVYKKTE